MLPVPGSLVWIALGFSLAATVGTHLIGRALIGLNFNKQRFGADFRFALVRLRENSEQVAMLRGEAAEAMLRWAVSARTEALEVGASARCSISLPGKVVRGVVTRGGQAIRFAESDCRSMGRDTRGVKGMTLGAGDEVIAMGMATEDADLFVITELGYGKRTAISKYPKHRRGGKGVRTITFVGVKGLLVGARVVKENQELMAVSVEGVVIRMSIDDISRMGRATQGVRIMKLDEADSVASIAQLAFQEGLPDTDTDAEPELEPEPVGEPETRGEEG
jgi:DNA gyrase/topoisomerase IV subunit A